MGSREAGYTIIEVTLFLAISGLLLLVAVIGTGNTIRSARFTDTGRSLHAYVQKQYDNILNGVNTRGQQSCAAGVVDPSGSQAAGTSNCLLLGKLMVMKQGESVVHTYNIVGSEPSNVDYNKSDEALIADFSPKIVRNVGVEDYNMPWGATISGSKRLIDSSAVDAFALIRSPRSTRIVYYTYKEPSDSYDLTPEINPSNPAKANNIGKPANFCVRSADGFGTPAKLSATSGQGPDAITIAFESVTEDCNGS